MAKNWGEIFAETFSQSYKDANQRAFERWKVKQELDPEYIKKKQLALLQYTNPELYAKIASGQGIMPSVRARPSEAEIEATLGGGIRPTQFRIGGSMTSPSLVHDELNKMYQELDKKKLEQPITAMGQTMAQEMKASEKKQRDLRRVQLKLDQSADILARAYQATQKSLTKAGIPLEAGRGIGGRLFGLAQKGMSKAGYNEFVKTYQGNLNEAAIALMRMAMPGRSERMVNLYKQTLPDLTGNPFEDIAQISESMTAAYGDALATEKDKKGKAKYSVKESRAMRDKFKANAYDRLKSVFVKAGVITPQQATTIRSKSGLVTKTENASILKRLKLDPRKYELVK